MASSISFLFIGTNDRLFYLAMFFFIFLMKKYFWFEINVVNLINSLHSSIVSIILYFFFLWKNVLSKAMLGNYPLRNLNFCFFYYLLCWKRDKIVRKYTEISRVTHSISVEIWDLAKFFINFFTNIKITSNLPTFLQ